MKTNKRVSFKLIALIILLTFCFNLSMVSVKAESYNILSKEITYLEDGSCFETIIYEYDSKSSRSTSTRTGSKTTSYKVDGRTLWYVSVTGTFNYNGSTSKCTRSSVDANSYDKYWKITSKSSSYSGNKATAQATAKLYYGPLPASTISKSVVLSCSANGKLS